MSSIMTAEIFITGKNTYSLETHKKRSDTYDNKGIADSFMEGFLSDCPFIREFPPFRQEINITIAQTNKIIGDVDLFDLSHIQQGVRGVELISNLFQEALGREVEPYTMEGTRKLNLSMTLYVGRIQRRISQVKEFLPEYAAPLSDFIKAIGMYHRLWLLQYEYPNFQVEGKPIGEYDMFGLFDLAEKWFWMKWDAEHEG